MEPSPGDVIASCVRPSELFDSKALQGPRNQEACCSSSHSKSTLALLTTEAPKDPNRNVYICGTTETKHRETD